MLNIDTRTADKKRPIPLFVEQSQFEQFTPTRTKNLGPHLGFLRSPFNVNPLKLNFTSLLKHFSV
jgi:hypothetical protein